jgi:large subunit ribosomal protein L4
MELAILNIAGENTGKKVKLDNNIFGIEPNDHAMYLDVKRYLAHQRQGTHKAKERSDITGSSRKIKRQKGSGTARAGDIKNPIFRGGGRTFGPQPRTYTVALNKKVKQLAKKSALSQKAKDKNILVIEDFSFDKPRTKDIISLAANMKISDKKSLIVLSERDNNIYLSSRNLKGIKVITLAELTTYDIMKSNILLFNESALAQIQKN